MDEASAQALGWVELLVGAIVAVEVYHVGFQLKLLRLEQTIVLDVFCGRSDGGRVSSTAMLNDAC